MKKLLQLFILLNSYCFLQAQIAPPVTITGTSCSPASLTATLTNSLASTINGFTTDSVVWQRNGATVQIYYAQPYTIVAGGNGIGNSLSQLASPQGFTIDAQENVYVADAANHRIQKWAKNVTSGVTVAGGNGAGSAANQLSSPFDVARDNSGALYICDRANHRIQKWVKNATSGVTVAGGNGNGNASNQFTLPNAIWLMPNGDLYISDNGNNRIVFWQNGAITGTTIANISNPEDILVDGNDLYVATEYGYIYKVDITTNAVSTFFGTGNTSSCATGEIIGAYGLAIDENKNIYLASKCKVKKIDPNGNEVFAYDNSTLNSRKLHVFNNILYVCDGQQKVIALTPKSLSPSYLNNASAGTYICYFYRNGTAYASNSFVVGNPFTIDLDINKLYKYSLYNDIQFRLTDCSKNHSLQIRNLPANCKVSWLKDGMSIIQDSMTTFGLDREISRNHVDNSIYTAGVSGVRGFYMWSAVKKNGEVFHSRIGNEYYCVAGDPSCRWGGLVVDKLENRYSNCLISGSNIQRASTTLTAIRFDKFDNLYVLDIENKCVIKYPNNLNPSTPGIIVCKQGLNKPIDLHINDNLEIFVLDSTAKAVIKFPSNSTETTTGVIVAGGFTNYFSVNKSLKKPTKMFVDSMDNIYVVDQIFSRVYDTTPPFPWYPYTIYQFQSCIKFYPNNYTPNNNINASVVYDDGTISATIVSAITCDSKGNLYLTKSRIGQYPFLYKHNKTGEQSNVPMFSSIQKEMYSGSLVQGNFHSEDIKCVSLFNLKDTLYFGYKSFDDYVVDKIYLYNKDNVLNTLQTGTYTATVTDTFTGCSSSSSITITIPTKLDSTQGSSSVCVGSSIQLTNNVPNGVWSSMNNRATVDANGLVTGANAGNAVIRYTVTNANGCVSFIDKQIVVNALPAIPNIAYAPGTKSPQTTSANGVLQVCTNKTFTLIGSPANGSWTTPGIITVTPSNIPVANASAIISTNTAIGLTNIKYEITDANGCKNSKTIVGKVVMCAAKAAVDETTESNKFSFIVYPNPTQGSFIVNTNTINSNAQLTITNVYGKLVYKQNLVSAITEINSKLSSGMYFINVVTTEGNQTQKLIVQ